MVSTVVFLVCFCLQILVTGLCLYATFTLVTNVNEDIASRLRALLMEVHRIQEKPAIEQPKPQAQKAEMPKVTRMASLRANLSAERTAEQEREERVASFNE